MDSFVMNYEEVENMEKSYQDIEEMIYYLGKLCREKAILSVRRRTGLWWGTNLSKEIREILVNLTLFQCQILLNDYFVPINKKLVERNLWETILWTAEKHCGACILSLLKYLKNDIIKYVGCI
mgnify:CR=1 FL=1